MAAQVRETHALPVRSLHGLEKLPAADFELLDLAHQSRLQLERLLPLLGNSDALLKAFRVEGLGCGFEGLGLGIQSAGGRAGRGK